MNTLCCCVWLKYLLPSIGTTLALFQIIEFVPNGVVCDDDRDVRGAGNDQSLGKVQSEWEGKTELSIKSKQKSVTKMRKQAMNKQTKKKKREGHNSWWAGEHKIQQQMKK